MTDFQELISESIHRSIIKPQDTIKKLCSPLKDTLRIANFGYIRIYQNGRFGHLSNCPDIVEFFFEDKLHRSHPYWRNPDLFEAGVALVPLAVDDYLRKKSQSLFQTDQTCMILKKFENYSDFFIFGPENLAKQDCHILFNQLHLLEQFAQYFRRETTSLMNKSVELGVNMKNELKEQFEITDPNFPLCRTDLKKEVFLKQISPLTPREYACLKLFKTGHSAQATGAKLKISQRTVEHHFENIKEKLGCQSKWDLLNM